MTPEEEISEHFRRARLRPAPEPAELRTCQPVNPVAELVKGLPPGTRLTVNVELPFDREPPVLFDPEADE